MGANRGKVRLIGGEFGGRRLHFQDKGGVVRPTSDRLRETLFNWLQFDLAGARVLDLFAGSGALGAEALSRGAAEAILVERARVHCNDLERQLRPVFGDRVSIVQADARTWLSPDQGRFDLVFVDPPYDLQCQARICRRLEDEALLRASAWIYVESDGHDPEPAVPANWSRQRAKSSGDARGVLYHRAGETG